MKYCTWWTHFFIFGGNFGSGTSSLDTWQVKKITFRKTWLKFILHTIPPFDFSDFCPNICKLLEMFNVSIFQSKPLSYLQKFCNTLLCEENSGNKVNTRLMGILCKLTVLMLIQNFSRYWKRNTDTTITLLMQLNVWLTSKTTIHFSTKNQSNENTMHHIIFII